MGIPVYGTLAQWIESQTSNLSVGGSNPSCLTIEKPPIFKRWRFFLCLFFFSLYAVYCRYLPCWCGKNVATFIINILLVCLYCSLLIGMVYIYAFKKYILHQIYIILVYKSEKPLKFQRFNWSEWRDSNSRLLRPERSALPAALHPEVFNCNKFIITPEVKMYIV